VVKWELKDQFTGLLDNDEGDDSRPKMEEEDQGSKVPVPWKMTEEDLEKVSSRRRGSALPQCAL
jgi:hypothetical protein